MICRVVIRVVIVVGEPWTTVVSLGWLLWWMIHEPPWGILRVVIVVDELIFGPRVHMSEDNSAEALAAWLVFHSPHLIPPPHPRMGNLWLFLFLLCQHPFRVARLVSIQSAGEDKSCFHYCHPGPRQTYGNGFAGLTYLCCLSFFFSLRVMM